MSGVGSTEAVGGALVAEGLQYNTQAIDTMMIKADVLMRLWLSWDWFLLSQGNEQRVTT